MQQKTLSLLAALATLAFVAQAEAADHIKIVSNFWHTPKARRYLKQLRPDLVPRLITARSHRLEKPARTPHN